MVTQKAKEKVARGKAQAAREKGSRKIGPGSSARRGGSLESGPKKMMSGSSVRSPKETGPRQLETRKGGHGQTAATTVAKTDTTETTVMTAPIVKRTPAGQTMGAGAMVKAGLITRTTTTVGRNGKTTRSRPTRAAVTARTAERTVESAVVHNHVVKMSPEAGEEPKRTRPPMDAESTEKTAGADHRPASQSSRQHHHKARSESGTPPVDLKLRLHASSRKEPPLPRPPRTRPPNGDTGGTSGNLSGTSEDPGDRITLETL